MTDKIVCNLKHNMFLEMFMENQDINLIVGQNLQKLRRSRKMTQLELAEKFNYSDKSISKWEKGESLPSIEVLYQLAKFYGVSLDSLTSENEILPETEQKEQHKDRLFPTKLIISLLAVSAVWIAATIWFVSYKLATGGTPYMLFMWSVPISCVLLLIFNSIWGKRQWLFWILSFLLWSLLVCIHIQLIEYHVWIIYFIGIPLQIAVILWGALMRKPKNKQPKEKPVKEKKIKKGKSKPEDEQTSQVLESTQAEQTSSNEQKNILHKDL